MKKNDSKRKSANVIKEAILTSLAVLGCIVYIVWQIVKGDR